MKYLKKIIQTVGVYLTSFTVFILEILKKALKKSSENDQSTGRFQSGFFFFFFSSPDPKSKKKSRKSTNKNSGLMLREFICREMNCCLL